MKIVIAGATGYIGSALIPKLLERFPDAEITALSRSAQERTQQRVTWKPCDLFSQASLQSAVPENVDLAFYLVHSMGPTAQLDQGTFADYDLLLADNFARAMKKAQVKHVIYLGGLTPETDKLSLHLQSRYEVEETFADFGLPLTIFRAGLILGQAGSSFQILLKLVMRIPLMICPHWTQTQTTPVDLHSVIEALSLAAMNQEDIGKTYDLAGCRPLTYIEMMRGTAEHLGKKRLFMPVPFFTPTLSRLWVSLITNTSKDLVYPLIESLEHPMVARPAHLYRKDWADRSYPELLKEVSTETIPGRSFFSFKAMRKSVRSVQRLPMPPDRNAAWVQEQYMSWLPGLWSPLIVVVSKSNQLTFSLLHPRFKLLKLERDLKMSDEDGQLFYIVGGWLAAKNNPGRLEFRVVLNHRFVLAAIHDFMPALPWFIYKYTQAQVHLIVMNRFARHLQRFMTRI